MKLPEEDALDGAELDFGGWEVEGVFGDAEKGAGWIGESDLPASGTFVRVGQSIVSEQINHGAGAIFRRVNQSDIRADDAGNGGASQGVMGATEHEGVDFFTQERGEAAFEDGGGDGVVEPAFFDERDQERTGGAENMSVWQWWRGCR
jgi:hypothetical protein